MTERIACGTVNCYIVGRRGACVLVDTGEEKYADKVTERARLPGVRLIVLTHCHIDHAGGAAKISDALGVPIAMNSADAPLICGEPRPMYADTFTGRLLLRMARSALKKRMTPFEPKVELCEGLELSAFGAEGTVLALPGHTLGSMGVLCDGELVAGDAAFDLLSPCRAKIYEDKAAADESWARILADDRITTVHVGHGGSFHPDRSRPAMTPVTE